MFPDLNLEDLQRHVDRMGKRLREKREDRRAPERGHMQALRNDAVSETFYHGPKIPLREPEEQPRGPKRVWRNPRQPEVPPPDYHGMKQVWNEAGSSSGGNPVEFEIADQSDGDEAGYISGASVDAFTVVDSDESDASIFGLRHGLHEVEEGDELSEASSQGNDEMAVAKRERVSRWRKDNLLLDDLDFAYVFVDFEEAYS